MRTLEPRPVTELSYVAYTHRQYQEITSEKLRERAGKVSAGGKFFFTGHRWRAGAYPGYAVVSMVSANPGNDKLHTRLQDIQSALAERLRNREAYYLLPPDSFHQTVANTLSAERFEQNVLQRGLAEAYPSLIKDAFERIPPSGYGHPIRMKIIGLSIFSSAIGVLGVFEEAEDFGRILAFRDAFYADAELGTLRIMRTRPFIGHITLAYVEKELSEPERASLAEVCAVINQSVRRQDLTFTISETGLRQYQDLSAFQYQPEYPIYPFTNPC